MTDGRLFTDPQFEGTNPDGNGNVNTRLMNEMSLSVSAVTGAPGVRGSGIQSTGYSAPSDCPSVYN